MTRSPLRVGLRTGRWLLPWIGVFFVSATLAYAMGGALAGGLSAGGHAPVSQIATTTDTVPGTATLERSRSIAAPADPAYVRGPDRCAVHGWTCLELMLDPG
jgi:hypothetical protein